MLDPNANNPKEMMEQEEEELIINLTDENGQDVPFYCLDLVPYEGKEYVVLLPASGPDDGEVVILEVSEGDEETESYIGVEDAGVLNGVLELFKERDLGLTMMVNPEYQTAREYQEKSIRIHEEAFQGDHSSARYQRILADAYRNMAELCQNCKDIPGEREYLEKALKLENTLCQKEPLREKTSLAACCRSLGDNYCKEGDWNSAWDYYRYYIFYMKLHFHPLKVFYIKVL